MKRIFIALNVNCQSIANLKCELLPIKEKLKKEKIKWVKDDIIHLTLCFLGEIKEEKLSTVKYQVSEIVKDYKPFKIKFSNLEVFPNIQRPRVIWVGVKSEELQQLGQKIQDEMKKLGFKVEDRKFSPHLTLGRIKFYSRELSDKVEDLIKEYQGRNFGTFQAKSVDIMESVLRPEGPKYITLESVNF